MIGDVEQGILLVLKLQSVREWKIVKEQSHKLLAIGKRNRYLCELIAREPSGWGSWTSGMSGSLHVRLPLPEEAQQKAKEERASNSSSNATPRLRRSTASFPIPRECVRRADRRSGWPR